MLYHPETSPPVPDGPHRILIVDDNPGIHEDFRKILCGSDRAQLDMEQEERMLFGSVVPASQTGSFELDSAMQGEEGLARVRQAAAEGRPYAMAFVDVRMPPGWDGIETVRHIWKEYPELQVVVCTAYSDYSWRDIRAALGDGDNVVILKKPFDNVEVLQLAHALSRKWVNSLKSRDRMDELGTMVVAGKAALQESEDRLQTEVDERRRVEHALQLSELRFKKAFHASPISIAILSLPDLRILDANRTLLELAGQSAETLLNRSPREAGLFGGDDRRMEAMLLGGDKVHNAPCEVIGRGKQPSKVLLSSERFQQDERELLLVLMLDVSELAELEAELHQAQKMEAVGQLAAGVAHDFNNILTVIQGHAHLRMADPNLGTPVQESFQHVADAAERAAGLTRQLLAFSRKQVIQPRPMDIADLVTRVVKLLRRLLGEHIRLEVENESELPLIMADPCNVEQILFNLCVNARDAMPEGGTLTIRTRAIAVDAQYARYQPEATQGHYVSLSVIDTGVGMDAATQKRIFEPFFTTKEVGKGTGLGLATVHGITKQHKGWIELDSQPGVGSTFRVFLPVAEGSAIAAPANEAGADLTVTRGSRTILYAEDEPNLRHLLTVVMEQHGYRVLAAANGLEAMELWRQQSAEIDLLLTDMVMPGGLSGRQLYERIARERPGVKVVFTSGYSGDTMGMDTVLKEDINYLPKPHSPAALAAMLARQLAGTSQAA